MASPRGLVGGSALVAKADDVGRSIETGERFERLVGCVAQLASSTMGQSSRSDVRRGAPGLWVGKRVIVGSWPVRAFVGSTDGVAAGFGSSLIRPSVLRLAARWVDG